MPDESPPPDTYGLTGVKRLTHQKQLDPAEAARRVARIRAAQRSRITMDQERIAAILHNPQDNLAKFKRVEWEVICRYLADPTLSAAALSGTMGMKPESVKRLLKRPHVQAMIGQIRAQQVAAMIRGDFGAHATLKAAQGKAAKKIVETIEDASAGAKLNVQAAESVLDRTGLGKSSAVEHHHVHEILRQFTPEELDTYGREGRAPERFAEVFKALEGPRRE